MISPQQLAWNQAFKDVKTINEIDQNFATLKGEIEKHCALLQKQVVIRVKAWLKKLSEEVTH